VIYLGWFKTKVSVAEAAGGYIKAIATEYGSWVQHDKPYLNGILAHIGIEDIEQNNEFASYEFMLATIALELQAVKNMLPVKHEEITDTILEIFSHDEHFGEYAVHTLKNEYLPEIESVINEQGIPFDGVLSILFEKLGIEFHPVVAAAFTELIGMHLGEENY
jgi:hypothetical protein